MAQKISKVTFGKFGTLNLPPWHLIFMGNRSQPHESFFFLVYESALWE